MVQLARLFISVTVFSVAMAIGAVPFHQVALPAVEHIDTEVTTNALASTVLLSASAGETNDYGVFTNVCVKANAIFTSACSNVVVRALRTARGMDLQQLIHEDMSANLAAYPVKCAWGVKKVDANIDHRRVINQKCYFELA